VEVVNLNYKFGEKMRVIFLTRYDRKAASVRYRFLQYIPFLESAGIKCSISPFFDDKYLSDLFKTEKKRFQSVAGAFVRRLIALLKIILKRKALLVIQTELLPYFPAIAEKVLSMVGIRYVLDYDDAMFHLYEHHRIGLVRWLFGKKIARIMPDAEVVIAGNRYIADYAQQSGASRVEIIPTVIDLDLYPLLPINRSVKQVFTIGWIGSPSTGKFIKMIAPALAEICADGKGRVVLIGSGEIELPGVPVEVLSWNESTEVDLMNGFDVGIMPLPDEPWTRGKCGFKLIQYMACGLPVIASPVGVNCEIVQEGVNGFLPVDNAGWIKAFNFLRDNVDAQRAMGANGRLVVEQRYCLQVTAPRLVRLLQDVITPGTA
jgi:glycosyltransferase involved in cell wall biosynthesis